ncbi:hypothetical protein SAMN05443248_6229 [Bradyrhizobium erythrophlei]|uniref:Uncharacterized protein n=1 Tax=Bradyrhizobium erythrophlei TaxID=1437360 RepID=A0A1M5VX17_9BRAD|nr:hypothetical protein SAMN05443248_6229 [Bradyrhizobium erythrophlei]
MFKQQNENAHRRTCTCYFERVQHGRHAEAAGDVTLLKMTRGARAHHPEASATEMKKAANSGGSTVV